MEINVVHQYSHLGEKLLLITYDALGVKLTGKLQFCDGCARQKSKLCAVREKTYTRAPKMGEICFVDTNGPFLESLIGNHYWIVAAYD